MAVAEKTRLTLFEKAHGNWGEEAANALMDYLPPDGWKNIATKADIERLRTEDLALLRADMDHGFTRLDGKIDLVAGQLDGKIDLVAGQLDGKIDLVAERLDGKVDGVEVRLDGKIDQLAERLDGKIDGVEVRLDRKIDLLSERLVSLDQKVDHLGERLDYKVDHLGEQLNNKIDHFAETLTVRLDETLSRALADLLGRQMRFVIAMLTLLGVVATVIAGVIVTRL